MGYKSMLVHLDDDARCAVRIEAATKLAQDFGAHLTGLYLLNHPELPRYARTRMGAELFQQQYLEAQRLQSKEMTERFNEQVKRLGLASAEIRVSHGDPVDTATLHARYADLLVVGQVNPEDDQAMMRPDFIELCLLSAGRPVLVMPYAGSFPTIGKRVLVAWNASRESARAVTDALPMLQRAEKVTVLAVNPRPSDGHGQQPGADVSLFLARHGVKVEAASNEAGNVDVGPWLLSRAADFGVDLIVMGGYGHSRLRELALGGVTRTMLQNMTVPVLMSH